MFTREIPQQITGPNGLAAGVPSRYFYENFADGGALNVAVFDTLLEELVRAGFAAVAQAPTALASQVRAALRCAIDYVADDPCKGRVAISIALASPVLAERRSHATELIATIIADMGSRYVSPNSDRAQLLTTTRFFVGGFSEILTVWMNDPSSATRDELVDSCTQLFLAVTAPVISATPS